MGITGHKRSSPEEKTDFSDTETGVLLKYYYGACVFVFDINVCVFVGACVC